MDGHERRAGPGDGATVPAGAVHAWWKTGEDEGIAVVEFRPALKTEECFESFFGLARDGKVSQKTGLPNVLWLASIFRTYHDFGHLAMPPLFVQRAVFAPSAPWRGCSATGCRAPTLTRPRNAQARGMRERRSECGRT